MRAARWLTLIWFLATLVALGWPGSGLPPAPNHADKLIHLLIFAAGTVLALAGWPHRRGPALAALLLFAPLAEVWQYVLPTDRSAEVMDAVANAAGVALGAAVMAWRQRGRDRRQRQTR